MPAPELRLRFHGRIIEHLGLQLYQSPVAALGEMIANAWDADSSIVALTFSTEGNYISVSDNGMGMSVLDCQRKYLNVGYARRGKNPAEKSPTGRTVLGRKGIGKFAGFGLAPVVEVDTTSGETGEHVLFRMELEKLTGGEFISDVENDPLEVLLYEEPDEKRRFWQGTTITLLNPILPTGFSLESFRKTLARRFLLHQEHADFEVQINEEPLGEGLTPKDFEYVFPRDLPPSYRTEIFDLENPGLWGSETVDGQVISWRILTTEEPIDEEELRGITVFAGGKLVQSPFFFNLTGGLGGQQGAEYMTGQVKADFLDTFEQDMVAPERQRVNWDHPRMDSLLQWGQGRVKQCLRVWRDLRGDARRRELEEKISGFGDRVNRLGKHERKTVKQALTRIAAVPSLSKKRFRELGEAMLTAWEAGRLRELITDLSEMENPTNEQFIEILTETEVLTNLHLAEIVRAKIEAISELRQRVSQRDLENPLRDHVAQHPELINPKWETFQVEKAVNHILGDAAAKAGLLDETYKGRIDLALRSGGELAILEFMRPGLIADWDHLQRCQKYVSIARTSLKTSTNYEIKEVMGLIVADRIVERADVTEFIRDNLQAQNILVMTWEDLLKLSQKQWKDFWELVVSRSPKDPRIDSLPPMPSTDSE